MVWGVFVWLFDQLLSVLSRPASTVIYPLYASVRAIESDSYSRNQQCLTCWVLFTLILVLEMVLAELLKCVPTWPYVKAVAIILLVLPFQGASYIYKRFIRAYFVEKLHFFVPTRQDDAASIADADMKCLRNEPKELEKHIVSQETFGSSSYQTVGSHSWPAGVKKVQEWSCALCQVTTTSNQCLESHLRGKKHKRRQHELKAYAWEKNRQKFLSVPNQNNRTVLHGHLNEIAMVNLAKWQGFVRSIMWCTWKKPALGWVKVNTDGSVDRQNSGFGGLLRDHRGFPIYAFVSKAYYDDVFLVELWAVWRGLVLASRLGFKYIWVESDSQSVVKTINRKQPFNARASTCLKHIWELLKTFKKCYITHAWRETNRAADYLSKMILDGSDVVLHPTDFPDTLHHIIKDDMDGRPYPRR